MKRCGVAGGFIGILKQLGRDRRGGIALIFGLMTPVIIGFTGLGIDGASWLMARNKLQSTSDGAAISAAYTLNNGGTDTEISAQAAKHFSSIYGSAAGAITVSVLHPPTSGSYIGDANAVMVTASRNQASYFLKVLGIDTVEIDSRAVAHVDAMTDACIVALAPSTDKALTFSGSSTVSVGCGLASNSTSSTAVYLSGSASVTASGVSSVGDIYAKGSYDLDTNGGPMRSHSSEITDPYGSEGRNLKPPASPTSCTATKLKIMADKTLTPGRYCNGIDFQKGNVTLQSGTYIIDGGTLSAGSQVSITGTDVTIILTGSGNDYATLNVNGGANLTLSAPTTGDYAGVVFFQDPNAPTKKGNTVISNKLNGSSTMKLSGAVYFPSQGLDYNGGGSSSTSCLQLIGYTVDITGNAKITSTCPTSSGASRLTRVDIELVE